jgi:DNA-binding MarR family transcriptional regulator/GNAT superfamily N-acetyltransferase
VDEDQAVRKVRAFNRIVTERVGTLSDGYLSRERPLAEARVLWEIGDQGCDVRTLRSRLTLDSGYLSRLLRSLERDSLITVRTNERDKRIRTVSLTKHGKRERDELDRLSDDLALSLLEPLTVAQRERLVSAMTEVERLLTATLIEFNAVDPEHHHAQQCLREYFAELDRRFDTGYDPATGLPAQPDEMRLPAGLFLVAFLRGQPIGCGALKFRGNRGAELKRMWASPAVRGLGVGRRLLQQLETRAAEQSARVIRLDSNRALTEALGLYRSSGYQEVDAFNEEPYANIWFEKHLDKPKAFP